MASGDLLATPRPTAPTTVNAAEIGWIDGGSTPAEAMEVFDFDAATDEYMDFQGRLSSRYAGTSVTLKFTWAAKSGTSGNVVWQAGFRRWGHGGNI